MAAARKHFIFAAIAIAGTGIAVIDAGRTYDANSAGKRIVNTSRVLKANWTTAIVNVATAIVRPTSA